MIVPDCRRTFNSAFQIYPYWNVNMISATLFCLLVSFQIYPYWNVNISQSGAGVATRFTFQIYPYWNVNFKKFWQFRLLCLAFQIYPYWNVNALEATASQIAAFCFQIYPYWNVNLSLRHGYRRPWTFQIYPYWNVNLSALAMCSQPCYLSNLSILECKCSVKTLLFPSWTTFKSIHIGM